MIPHWGQSLAMCPAPPFSSSLSASPRLLLLSHLAVVFWDFRSRFPLSLQIHLLLLPCWTSHLFFSKPPETLASSTTLALSRKLPKTLTSPPSIDLHRNPPSPESLFISPALLQPPLTPSASLPVPNTTPTASAPPLEPVISFFSPSSSSAPPRLPESLASPPPSHQSPSMLLQPYPSIFLPNPLTSFLDHFLLLLHGVVLRPRGLSLADLFPGD